MKNTICPLPWINLAQTSDNNIIVCSNNIISTGGILQESTSTDFQNIRQEMINGVVPAHCKKCFAEEEKGLLSKRQGAINNYQNFDPKDANPHDLKSIEVYSKFANTVEIGNVSSITFLEENSLDIKEHYDFLIDIVATGKSKGISLIYNLSDCKGFNNKIINVWGQFKHVKFNLKLDTEENKHDWLNPDTSYRYVMNILTFIKSVKANHVDVNITTRVNLLTVPYLDRLASWKEHHNPFGVLNRMGEIINLQMDDNVNLDIRRLPKHLKGYTKLKIERVLDKHRLDTLFNSNPNGRAAWQGIIDYMYSEDLSQNLPDTLNYLKEQDAKNNTNWREVFPELTDIEDDL